jgi:D-serine deaminase-like pyridoxal phosphate-dependent protein
VHDPGVPPRRPFIPGGLDTPALVVDLDVVDANNRRLVDYLGSRGISLRPHTKTHKSVALARLQLAAGARGITVGTLGEAEVFATAGIGDVFLAYPLWADGPKAARLRALHQRTPITIGLDSVTGAARLAAALAGLDQLRVMVELDSGGRRTGVASAEAAVEVAKGAAALGLRVIGVFTHGGHGYAGRDARAAAAADEVRTLGAAAAALEAAGIPCAVVSAGSTPTMHDAASGAVTEIRAGTYILGDRGQAELGAIRGEDVALHVASTVVSTAVPGQVVLDAGAKTLTKDRAPFLVGYGLLPAYPDAVIERVNDYHGIAHIPPGTPAPRLGEVVAIVPNHVCPVVDLFDDFTVVRGAMVVGIWPVDARGRRG